MEALLLQTTTRNSTLASGFEARRREEQLLGFRAELSAARRTRRRRLARAAWSRLKSGSRDGAATWAQRVEAPDVREALR
jgi:hypothetical protein